MAYKKYKGNSGSFVRVMEPREQQRASAPVAAGKNAGPPALIQGHSRNPVPHKHKHSPHFPGFGFPDFRVFLKNLGIGNLETEDILLILILLFLYKESGDIELLIILGVLLFL
ncbi:MAG: hypothetical protein ACOX7I_00120 [Oscillospiraceae bacterium]